MIEPLLQIDGLGAVLKGAQGDRAVRRVYVDGRPVAAISPMTFPVV